MLLAAFVLWTVLIRLSLKSWTLSYLDCIIGLYLTPQGDYVRDCDVEEFDKEFSPKQKLKLPGQLF